MLGASALSQELIAGAETRWVERGEARLLTWEEIFAQLDGPATLSGEISDEGYRALQVAKQANPLLKVLVAPAQSSATPNRLFGRDGVEHARGTR
ncbi:MAG UNVERIFIED_CONTAM: hypothetical protein LVT10_10050 [Anaerolineae bacterium]|jgi:hypothetical protein